MNRDKIKNYEEQIELRKNDDYEGLAIGIKENFKLITNSEKHLFTTDAEGLFDAFLENLPEEARQHYNCKTCRKFVDKFGGLVSISEKGEVRSAIWGNVPEFFKQGIEAMKNIILKANVNGVFVSKDVTLGQPTAGGWNHMSVELPRNMVSQSVIMTPYQEMAMKAEEYRILTEGLKEYSIDIIKKAVELLQTDALYRSERCLGVAEWLYNLQIKLSKIKNNKIVKNCIWLAVATAPVGFCHVKSSMIGTLLDDIKSGLSFESVSSRFAAKMNPANYMRSQVAPSQGNIQQAEKIIKKLGIEESLRRRYATFDEIPYYIWKNNSVINEPKKSKGIFSNIISKEKVKKSSDLDVKTTVMTWEKFKKTILPIAENIEVRVDNTDRLMAMVTASDNESPNVLQWDNRFSWYYHNGIDGEFKERVENAGGRYEDNEIRCSLIWNSYSDLDIHCITPKGKHIYYGDKMDEFQGYLDIDMNAGSGQTNTPVENIRWINNAPQGVYRFYVHNYSDRNSGYNPFKVELNINGVVYKYSGVAYGTSYREDIFQFKYIKGQQPNIEGSGSSNIANEWNISENKFIKVKGITNSPNLWEEKKVPHIGSHIFFLLDGCKDKSQGKGRGFFNETLKSELHEVRKTLEAYTASTPIEEGDNATACGIGYSNNNEWNLILKVTTDNSTRLIKIDRWD